MIKLAVGVDDLDHFLKIQRGCVVDYHGTPANAVRTRYKARRAEEIIASGGSLYRVIKNRIQCRQKILGFASVETEDKGTQCLIMVAHDVIQTISTPKRPFQGWRYFEPAAVPRDRGVYLGDGQCEDIPVEMEKELKEAGLL